jgi:hypothetical protein
VLAQKQPALEKRSIAAGANTWPIPKSCESDKEELYFKSWFKIWTSCRESFTSSYLPGMCSPEEVMPLGEAE